MPTVEELAQRVADRRAEGARLLTTEETLALLAVAGAADNACYTNRATDLITIAMEQLEKLP